MAFDYIFGIASYDRAEKQHMLNYLHGLGYPKERIIISTQIESDFEEYKKRYDSIATIIYRNGDNISKNRNTVLMYAEKYYNGVPLIMCSDKVRSIMYMEDGRTVEIKEPEIFDRLIKKSIQITKKLGGILFGLNSIGNAFYMKHTISTNKPMLGCFMGILDSNLRFDERFRLKEDWQLILDCIDKGKRTIRFDDIAIKATLHTKGGCYKDWNSKNDEINRNASNLLLQLYPTITTRHSKRINEIRFTNKSRLIKHSILELI